MAGSPNVRRYVRVAERRLADARFLQEEGRPEHQTGAVYLAGYAVECGLKALLLSRLPATGQPADVMTHRILGLRDDCRAAGVNFRPEDDGRDGRLRRLARWDVALRYNPGNTDRSEAEAFLRDAADLLAFVTRSV